MSLTHAIAPPVEIEFDGERLFLPPLTLTHIGTIIDYMRGKLVDNVPAAIAAAKEIGDAGIAAMVVREALKERRESQDISLDKAMPFIDGLEGLSLALFLLLDQQYPNRFTRDGIFRSILKLAKHNPSGLHRLGSRLAVACGLDGEGNSTPAGAAATPAGTETSSPSESTGSTS